jgi:hypothetical protein
MPRIICGPMMWPGRGSISFMLILIILILQSEFLGNVPYIESLPDFAELFRSIVRRSDVTLLSNKTIKQRSHFKKSRKPMDLDDLQDFPSSQPSLNECLACLDSRSTPRLSDQEASLSDKRANGFIDADQFVFVIFENGRQLSGPFPPPKRHYTTFWRSITRKAVSRSGQK